MNKRSFVLFLMLSSICLFSLFGCDQGATESTGSGNQALPRGTFNYGEPAWGSNGWIVFGHSPYDSLGNYTGLSGWYLVRPDGSGFKPYLLTRDVGILGRPEWSLDGKYLFATLNYNRIVKIDFNTKEIIDLSESETVKAHVSSDTENQNLYFSINISPTKDVGIFRLDFSDSHPKKVYGGLAMFPSYSRYTKKLYFALSDSTTGYKRLVRFDVQDSIKEQMWDVGVELEEISPNPKGDLLLVCSHITDTDPEFVWLFDPVSGEKKVLTKSGGNGARWSPDGQQFVYLKINRRKEIPGNGKLWISDINNSTNTQIVF